MSEDALGLRRSTSERLVLPPPSVDELMERYVCWREECQVVNTAFERWGSRLGRRDRHFAFLAYGAALEREERAAQAYREFGDRLFR
jgi:hypothetical protein